MDPVLHGRIAGVTTFAKPPSLWRDTKGTIAGDRWRCRKTARDWADASEADGIACSRN